MCEEKEVSNQRLNSALMLMPLCLTHIFHVLCLSSWSKRENIYNLGWVWWTNPGASLKQPRGSYWSTSFRKGVAVDLKTEFYENLSSSIIASCQPRYSISSPFFSFRCTSHPFPILIACCSTWLGRLGRPVPRPLRPQWRTVGAMQIATRASWPWAPFNWDKARTVTWYVSGKVMKVTGFDIFNWNLAMTSDLLKVNQGRNSNQNSVIGGERCCHVFWNQTCSQHSTHSSWTISRHHFLDVVLEIRNESTHFNLSQIVPFINLQEKRAKNCQCTWKTFYTQTYFSCDKTCVFLQYMLPVRHPCPFHVATLPGTLLSCWFRAYHRCWNRSFVGNRSSTTKLPRASQQRFAPSVLDFSPWVVGSNFAEQE